jgi:hypothetical protein
MKNKQLHPLAAVAVLVLALVELGVWGWRVLNRGDIGPNGEDYSIPAVQPKSYRVPSNASGGPAGAGQPR